MATTVSIGNLPTNPIDVSVHRYAGGDFGFRKQYTDNQGFEVAEYIYLGGDQSFETTVAFRTGFDKQGVKRSSVQLVSQQTVTTDSLVAEVAPISVNIGWNTPGAYEDPAAIMKMIGVAFGLTFGTLVTKVPQNEVVNGVNRVKLNGFLA